MNENVVRIMAETFRVKESDIFPELAMEDMDEWDSLMHMELIANLEEELGVEFDVDEITEMNTVAKVLNIIEAKLNGNKE